MLRGQMALARYHQLNELNASFSESLSQMVASQQFGPERSDSLPANEGSSGDQNLFTYPITKPAVVIKEESNESATTGSFATANSGSSPGQVPQHVFPHPLNKPYANSLPTNPTSIYHDPHSLDAGSLRGTAHGRVYSETQDGGPSTRTRRRSLAINTHERRFEQQPGPANALAARGTHRSSTINTGKNPQFRFNQETASNPTSPTSPDLNSEEDEDLLFNMSGLDLADST